MTKRSDKIIFLFLFLSLTAAMVQAEQIDEPIVCNGDEIEYFEQERKVVGSGNIHITYKDTVLTCDKVIVWTDTKEAEATGNVRIVQDKNFFTGDSMRYNFEKQTGSVVNYKGYTDPWYSKGNFAQRTRPDEFIVTRGYVTSCEHEQPHYRISARKVLIYPNIKVVVRDATLWVGKVPVMWIPVYAHPLDEDRPRVTVIPGKNDEWGNFVLTAWRYNLDSNHKGYVHMDYRERKDFAHGIDHIYDTNIIGKGILKTYYIHERDLKREHIYSEREKDERTIEREKFLVQLRHKWRIFNDTELIGELYKYRDKNFRKDYFNDSYNNEYEKDKNPKSYLLVTKTQPIYNLSVLAEKRANRFEDTVERLPEVKLTINNNRIDNFSDDETYSGEGGLDIIKRGAFYYTGEFDAVSLNKKYPRSTDEEPVSDIAIHHNNRFDTYNKLSYATKLSFLNITPHTATRQTYYDRGLNGDDFGSDSHMRGIFYTGVDVSTKFYKVFPVQGKPLGIEINNLRHIITPLISYGYNPRPTLYNNEMFVFDSIDSIDRNSIISPSLENKLQTKRGKNMESVDLASLNISTSYDFKHTPGTEFSDYLAKLELRPYDWLTITSDTTIDSHRRYHHRWLKSTNTDIVLTFEDYFRFGISHSYTNAESNNILGQLEWDTKRGWKIKVYESFDIKRVRSGNKKMYDLREQRYAITKDLHCWEVDLYYNVFREKGEEMLIVFRLKALPDLPFEFGRNYHEPKRGSQDYGAMK